jgi:hypothetical protein
MTPINKLIVRGASAVIVYDFVASIISKYSGVHYANFTVGSLLIYAAVGFLASRGRLGRTAMATVLAGAVVGLTDATFGWAVSYLIGPGQPAKPLTPLLWAFVAVIVTLSAAVLAAMGYAIGSLVFRKTLES